MEELSKFLLDLARVVITLIGGGIGLVKIVKGKSDEDPKCFNEGLLALVGAGVLVAATFGIAAIFK